LIRFKAIVSNISIIDNPWGEKAVRIDLTEERELPGPVVVQRGQQNEISREIVPILSQVIKSIPVFGASGKVRVPRLTLYLTEDEWEKLLKKPSIGDLIEVQIASDKVKVIKK